MSRRASDFRGGAIPEYDVPTYRGEASGDLLPGTVEIPEVVGWTDRWAVPLLVATFLAACIFGGMDKRHDAERAPEVGTR